MSKRFVWTAGLVVVLLLIVSALVMAQSTAVSEATLVVNNGEVTVSRAGTDKLYTVFSGEAVIVTAGDVVTTSETATAQLHLEDGGTVDLFEATSVEITKLVTTEEKYQVTFTMLAGRTLNRVVHLLGIEDHYEVRTPSSTASVRGTVFAVDILSQESTYVSVDAGVVNVTMGEQSVDVKAGFEVTAVTGELLMVKAQHQEEPEPIQPNPTTTPTEVPATVAPTEEPEPTEVPEETPSAAVKNGTKVKETQLVPIPTSPPTVVDPGYIPEQPINDGNPTNPNNPTDPTDPSYNPDQENGGNPHDGMIVPGSPPGDGQTPDGGAEPPGQGGTPPGQTDNPGNGGDNNSGGGGKKDK